MKKRDATAKDIADVAGDFLDSHGAIDRLQWNAMDMRSKVIWAARFCMCSPADLGRLVNPGGLN